MSGLSWADGLVSVLSIESLGVKPLEVPPERERAPVSVLSIESLGVKLAQALGLETPQESFSTLYRVVGGETLDVCFPHPPPIRVSVLSIESLGVKPVTATHPTRPERVSVLSIESLGVKPAPNVAGAGYLRVSVLSIESLGVKLSQISPFW